MNLPDIYLASSSPRRLALLQQMGITPICIVPDIDETYQVDEKVHDYVMRMAMEKAQAGWQQKRKKPQWPVLAADTIVVLDEQILGKPKNRREAGRFLKLLSGRTHQVMTAVALMSLQGIQQSISVNQVSFSSLTSSAITWYINTGEGMDKAGSYAVQGLAARFIEQIVGSYSGIMGLPIWETEQLLQQYLIMEQT